ncbi:Growth-regulating factor 6, partial [Cucurbita argyrosperma subsp. sororia]
MNYRGYNPSEGISSTQEAAETQHSLRQFFNNWPKNQSDSSSVSWSNSNLDLQSDRTQLSISIPMATSDFRSSTSSPANEKVTLSPLKSLQEMDPLQMGLGVGNVMDEPNNRQANWIPISWESSMGGPLGEVLHSTNNIGGELKSSSNTQPDDRRVGQQQSIARVVPHRGSPEDGIWFILKQQHREQPKNREQQDS